MIFFLLHYFLRLFFRFRFQYRLAEFLRTRSVRAAENNYKSVDARRHTRPTSPKYFKPVFYFFMSVSVLFFFGQPRRRNAFSRMLHTGRTKNKTKIS